MTLTLVLAAALGGPLWAEAESTDRSPDSEAVLVLDGDLAGRLLVRDEAARLVADLFKPFGRPAELSLAPGLYEVRSEVEAASQSCVVELAEGERRVLGPADLPLAGSGATHRAPAVAESFGGLSSRSRLELSLGYREGATYDPGGPGSVVTFSGAEKVSVSLGYAHWLSEDLASTLVFNALSGGDVSSVGPEGVSSSSYGVASLLLGIRRYLEPTHDFRPYLAISVGPFLGGGDERRTYPRVVDESGGAVAFGGNVGVGLDVQLSRSWMLGASAGYDFMTDFSRPVGGRDNFGGFGMGVGVSWLFGRGEVR